MDLGRKLHLGITQPAVFKYWCKKIQSLVDYVIGYGVTGVNLIPPTFVCLPVSFQLTGSNGGGGGLSNQVCGVKKYYDIRFVHIWINIDPCV